MSKFDVWMDRIQIGNKGFKGVFTYCAHHENAIHKIPTNEWLERPAFSMKRCCSNLPLKAVFA